MPKMFWIAFLSQEFSFPDSTEQEHWLAVRGLLFHWMRDFHKSEDLNRRLSEAISEVNRILLILGVRNPSEAPRPSSALFGYYLKVVSNAWDWLYQLNPHNCLGR
jgi:hypothetical protein